MALQRSSTVAECLEAVKSFEVADLGFNGPQGGAAKRVKVRVQVLERLRARFPPLPPEQQNEW